MNLDQIMKDFLAGGDLSPEAWQRELREKGGPSIRADILAARKKLKRVGVRELSNTSVDLSVAQVIKGSDDIRAALVAQYQEASRDSGGDALKVAAALAGYLSLKRLALTEASLKQRGVDLYTRRAVQAEVGRDGTSFTGRKRFRAVEGGRHHELNSHPPIGLDEKFSIGERKIIRGNKVRTLPAKEFAWAREDITDVEEWSNSTSYIEIEKTAEDGSTHWVRV